MTTSKAVVKKAKKTVEEPAPIEVGMCDSCGSETQWMGFNIRCEGDVEDPLNPGETLPCEGVYQPSERKADDL